MGLYDIAKEFHMPRRLGWVGWALSLTGLAFGLVIGGAGCSKKDDDPAPSPPSWKTPGKTFSNYDQRNWLSSQHTYIAADKINGAAIDVQYSDTATGTPVIVASDGFENRFIAFTGDEKYILFEKRDSGDTFRTIFAWDIVNSQLLQATPSSGRFEFKDFDDQAIEFCYKDIDTDQKFVNTLGTTFTQNTEFTGSDIEEYAYDKNSQGDFLIILSRDMGGGKHDLLFKDPQDDTETNVTNTPALDEIFIFEFRKLTGNGQPMDQGTWLILQELAGGNYRIVEYNPRDKEVIRVFADGTRNCSIPNDPEGLPLVSENERFIVFHKDHGSGEQHVYLYDRHEEETRGITTRIPPGGQFKYYEANLIADSGNIIMRRDELTNVWNVFWYWHLSDHLTMATNDPDKNNYAVAISVDGEEFAFVKEDKLGGTNKRLIATSNSLIHNKHIVSTKYPVGPTGGIPFGARFIIANEKNLLIFSEEETAGGDVEGKSHEYLTDTTTNITQDPNFKDYHNRRSGDRTRGIFDSRGASSQKMKITTIDATGTQDYQ
ncbi:MAG: hypothetical protein KAT43_06580 [Nanoarchaeota archaeon]|nr:hypothetical protein [Nanoarchaeota archaeon]